MAAGAGVAVASPGGLACVDVDVTELHRSQSSILKDMRLKALDDAPSAFVTTLESELDRPPDYWEEQFDRATWVIAQDGIAPDDPLIVGIAALVRPDPESPVRFIESVWVEPAYRRRGVLRQMLDQLEGCAKKDGATELRLWVLDTNESVVWAYQKLDFDLVMVDGEQDTTKRRPDGTFVKEHLMFKSLL
jgi:GNAT superfamily N-acetyltransferase